MTEFQRPLEAQVPQEAPADNVVNTIEATSEDFSHNDPEVTSEPVFGERDYSRFLRSPTLDTRRSYDVKRRVVANDGQTRQVVTTEPTVDMLDISMFSDV